MRVLIVSSGEDSGGVGNSIKRAFDRHAPDWEVRQVRLVNNYLDYPVDIQLSARNVALVDELFEKADVVHMMERWWGARRYASFEAKPKIMHHHGTIFRQDPTPLLDQAAQYGAISVVSTIDLLLSAPRGMLRWVPNPVDIGALSALRRTSAQPSRPRVVHAPTGREKKGTAEWLAALAPLDAELDLIEGVTWQECLRRKSGGHLLMDQLRVGYGLNAVEAWAMGIPVISGVEDVNVRDRMVEMIGYLPFYPTTPSTVPARLREIVEDATTRDDYARVGEQYVCDFHDELNVVSTWQDIYREAIER